MSIFKTSFYGVTLFALYSCSFNTTFHRPVQTATPEKTTHYYSGKDTTLVEYNRANQEIVLRDTDFERLNKGYRIKVFYFASSNGNLLNGWLLIPEKKQPLATILHYHGSAGNLITHYRLIDPLVEYGYQVFMFDYSGYGCSEGTPTHETVLEDGYSALEYLNNSDELRTEKTIIYGQSYGGYLASIIGSNSQQHIDGIVIEGAFSSLREEAKHKASIFGNFVKKGVQADKEIQKNKLPLLVIHSKEDEMVPVKLGQKIYSNANLPKEFYEIDGLHVNGLEYYPDEITEKIYRMIVNQ
ncbi:MAG: alpha/beta fold hydrolase [Flavobacteriaceae bacterium]